MPKKPSPTPPDLVVAARRVESWRRRRSGRRLPGELWGLAVGLARTHGVSPTSRALRLDYKSLRRRVERTPVVEEAPAFVELVPGVPAASGRTVVEFEDPTGTKMRVGVEGPGAPDLLSLARLFLEGSR